MGDRNEPDRSAEAVYGEMAVLEPYTTGELASSFDAPRRRIRTLLKRLADAGRVRRKDPEPDSVIWIREPPAHECDACGYRYEVKFLHPVLAAVRYCPRCGSKL